MHLSIHTSIHRPPPTTRKPTATQGTYAPSPALDRRKFTGADSHLSLMKYHSAPYQIPLS